MRTVLASEEEISKENFNSLYELDKMLSENDFDYIDEEDDDGIYRHPSNKGSVIIDAGRKIFVPDARYRIKRIKISSSAYSYNFNVQNNPYLDELYDQTTILRNSTQINNKILEFNREHENSIQEITCFDYCNNIRVPKVGNCIIPSCDQLEMIISYNHELDELDGSVRLDKNRPFSIRNASKYANKSFACWGDSGSCYPEFISCDLTFINNYRGEKILGISIIEMNSSRFTTYKCDRYIERSGSYSLLPIIEL